MCTRHQGTETRRSSTASHVREAGDNRHLNWTSQDPTNTPVELNSKINVDEDKKILGLKWDPRLDGFLVNSEKPVLLRKLTKRIALSLISKIFDPLGFFTPFLIRAKIVFQSLWAYQLEWDSPLPEEESDKIRIWLSEVEGLKDFSISRQFFPGVKWTDVVKLELHVFCDASPLVYGTVIYMRGFVQGGDDTRDENRHDKPVVSFCISKARVAPVKTETLPRLELTACVLGFRMSKFVTRALAKGDIATFFWSDSKICLGWINQGAQKYKEYVGNRVKEIIECAPARFWQYCPTEKNPADLITRGISVNTFLNSDVWVRGPKELLDRQVTFVPKHSSVALTSEGRPLSTEAVLGSAAKPQPVNELLNIETQTLATNSAESAGKDYVSCLNVIPESNFTKSNINDGFVNQAYIQLIPNKMDLIPEILESLLEISFYKRMIRVMAWVLRAATIFKVILSHLKHLTLKNWPGGKPLSKPSYNVSIFQKKFGVYIREYVSLADPVWMGCTHLLIVSRVFCACPAD